MEKLLINGGTPLNGSVSISGAKNASLPIFFSTILANGTHKFSNVPGLQDIHTTCRLLEHLGAQIKEKRGGKFDIRFNRLLTIDAPYNLVRTMRASILCLGPLVAKYRMARVSLPGGCAIGARPVNLHLSALKKMGVMVEIRKGYIEAQVLRLKGARIRFKKKTVTGTENIIMAATLAEGKTTLENSAREPEITDLCDYLRAMGARISGDGTSTITIEGVRELKPASHSIMPDRIEAATYLIAAAATGGEINVENCNPGHLEIVLKKLKETGCKITTKKSKGVIHLKAADSPRSASISTAPFPGFATDIQAQWMAYMTQAKGISTIRENIFENRFMHVPELMRMGATIDFEGKVATVRGNGKVLCGAEIMATDLRASASLVIAALAAQGTSIVNRIYHLDRGYEILDKKLQKLGASVERVH